jgi:hypothetical protein
MANGDDEFKFKIPGCKIDGNFGTYLGSPNHRLAVVIQAPPVCPPNSTSIDLSATSDTTVDVGSNVALRATVSSTVPSCLEQIKIVGTQTAGGTGIETFTCNIDPPSTAASRLWTITPPALEATSPRSMTTAASSWRGVSR